MAKPSIYVANIAETSVEANQAIPLGNIVKRPCNRNLVLSGNTINVSDCYQNYYDVVVSATFTAPAAGDVTLELRQNGVPVIGATATETITTAETETRSISFSATIRATSGCIIDQLQVINAGVPAAFTNVSVRVIKN